MRRRGCGCGSGSAEGGCAVPSWAGRRCPGAARGPGVGGESGGGEPPPCPLPSSGTWRRPGGQPPRSRRRSGWSVMGGRRRGSALPGHPPSRFHRRRGANANGFPGWPGPTPGPAGPRRAQVPVPGTIRSASGARMPDRGLQRHFGLCWVVLEGQSPSQLRQRKLPVSAGSKGRGCGGRSSLLTAPPPQIRPEPHPFPAPSRRRRPPPCRRPPSRPRLPCRPGRRSRWRTCRRRYAACGEALAAAARAPRAPPRRRRARSPPSAPWVHQPRRFHRFLQRHAVVHQFSIACMTQAKMRRPPGMPRA